MRVASFFLLSAVIAASGCGKPQESHEVGPTTQSVKAPTCLKDRVGIGVTLHFDETTNDFVVAFVWKGSPAEAAGIKAGDHIDAIDGVDLAAELVSVRSSRPIILEETSSDVRKKCDDSVVKVAAQFNAKLQKRALGDRIQVRLRSGQMERIAEPTLGPLADLYESANAGSPPGVILFPMCFLCSGGPPCHYSCEAFTDCTGCTRECIAC